MRSLCLAALLTMTLSACGPNATKPTDAHPAYYGCLAATGAAAAMTAYNNTKPLPLDVQNTTKVYVGYIDTICSSPTPYTNSQIKGAAFQDAAAYLVAEAAKLGAK